MADGAEGSGAKVSFRGGCQCGAVRYSIEAERLVAYACHCRECQKQAASAFGVSVPVFTSLLKIEGETGSWSRRTDSGNTTQCHFCRQCGIRLYHAGSNRPGMVTIKGGSLDEPERVHFVAHIWTRRKVAWIDLPADVPQWETQPQSQDEWMTMLGWT